MATLQQVMDALTAQIRLAVPLAPAAGGFPYVCYSGWPAQDALKRDVVGKIRSHISVYDLPAERNTTRFPADWLPVGTVTPNLTATVAGNVITFSGAPDVGGNIATTVNKAAPVLYQETGADTLNSISTNVAAAINTAAIAGITASASGASVTVLGSPVPAVTVTLGATGNLISIQRQQDKDFLVTIWSPDPTTRDAIAGLVDGLLGTMNFIPIPNDYPARILYQRTRQGQPQFDAQAFRRDLVYSIEYWTTAIAPATQIVTTPTTLGQL